jgi:predicted HicB family RNase H-like nuclease
MGAPLTKAESGARHLNLYIDGEVVIEAKIKAIKLGTSLSQVVEELIKEWLKKKK